LSETVAGEVDVALTDKNDAFVFDYSKLVLGSDNGSAFTARRFKEKLAELGIRHRRGGYRDPESQAFIESWFGKLTEREVWLNEYETLDDARRGIGGYVDRYRHRPHSRLDYKTALRGQADLGRATKRRGLTCQLRRGARHEGPGDSLPGALECRTRLDVAGEDALVLPLPS